MCRLTLWIIGLTVFFLCPSIASAGLTVQLGQNFTASTLFQDTFAEPPDSDGAIGPNHFVEFINGRFSVFEKHSGTNLQTSTDMLFWENAGVTFGGGVEVSDPRIIYDSLTGRWFASEIDFDFSFISNRFLLAVSASSDPTSTWNAVSFQADPAGNFADFPRLGLDAKGVYLSANMFDASENLIGVLLTSIPKEDLLMSSPTATNRICSGVLPISDRGFSLEPVVNFNATNDTEKVLAVAGDGTDFLPQTNLVLLEISGAETSNATLSASTKIECPEYFVNINPPQPDGQTTLDDGDARIGSYVFQIGNVLYATHAVQVGPRAVIRWYRVNASDNSLLESGTIADTNLDLFYPSIAVGTNGIVVIGFNGCSTNTFVSSYAVVGQTIGNQTFFGEKILLKAGIDNYERVSGGVSRWGDYSTTTVDSSSPNHFWTIQQFVSSANIYSTQVTELIVNDVPPVLGIASLGPNVTLSWSTDDIGYSLQSTANPLPPTIWSSVTNGVSIVGGQNQVNVPISGTNQFFRLIR